MHDKFCIVDLDYIMHGSYNWTKAANYNGETLVTTVDRELVRDFADEFLKMYNENRWENGSYYGLGKVNSSIGDLHHWICAYILFHVQAI